MPLTEAQAILGSAAIGAASGFLGSDHPGGRNLRSAYKKRLEYDQDFYSNQLQWRVADAKKAGLHPLFALGGTSTPSAGSVISGQRVPKTNQTRRALAATSEALNVYAQTKSQIDLNKSMANYYDALATKNQPGLSADKATADAVQKAESFAYENPRGKPKPSLYWEATEDGGRWKRTAKDSRMDIGEAFGPMVDRFIHNPKYREKVYRGLGEGGIEGEAMRALWNFVKGRAKYYGLDKWFKRRRNVNKYGAM